MATLPNLMRRNTTANIAKKLGGPALIGPPAVQPPQTDPFTPGPGRLPSANWSTNPNPTANPAWLTYESLMRSAGRPIDEHLDAGGTESLNFEEPPLPSPDPGEIEPGILPGNIGNPPPNYLPPIPVNDPGGLDPIGTNPGPIVETGPWPIRVTNPSGISGGNAPRGNYFPTFNGGPHIPGRGGQVGTGTTDPRPWWNQAKEPWYGKVARALMPYASGQISHAVMNAYRRNQLKGTVGGAAHAVRRGNQPDTQRATQPAQDPSQRPGTRWDFTRGAYVQNNNATGAQFSPRASHAMTMWDQGRHQPVNQMTRAIEGTSNRFYGGNRMRLDNQGGFEAVPGAVRDPNAPLYRATTQLPNTTDPNFALAMAAANRRMMAGRGG